MILPITRLVDGASWLFAVTPAHITSKQQQSRRTFRARVAVVLAAREAGYSFPQIGKHLGGRDHKTIMNARDQALAMYEADEHFRTNCDKLVGMVHRHAA